MTVAASGKVQRSESNSNRSTHSFTHSPVKPTMVPLKPMEHISLVAVGPSITGITQSMKIASMYLKKTKVHDD